MDNLDLLYIYHKNKLERSIWNINREIEEAQREFSKLFEDSNYEM